MRGRKRRCGSGNWRLCDKLLCLSGQHADDERKAKDTSEWSFIDSQTKAARRMGALLHATLRDSYVDVQNEDQIVQPHWQNQLAVRLNGANDRRAEKACARRKAAKGVPRRFAVSLVRRCLLHDHAGSAKMREVAQSQGISPRWYCNSTGCGSESLFTLSPSLRGRQPAPAAFVSVSDSVSVNRVWAVRTERHRRCALLLSVCPQRAARST